MVKRKKVFALASTVKVSSAERQRSKVLVDRFQERFRGRKPATQIFSNVVSSGTCNPQPLT